MHVVESPCIQIFLLFLRSSHNKNLKVNILVICSSDLPSKCGYVIAGYRVDWLRSVHQGTGDFNLVGLNLNNASKPGEILILNCNIM